MPTFNGLEQSVKTPEDRYFDNMIDEIRDEIAQKAIEVSQRRIRVTNNPVHKITAEDYDEARRHYIRQHSFHDDY